LQLLLLQQPAPRSRTIRCPARIGVESLTPTPGI